MMPGKENLPSEELDSFIEFGCKALKKLFNTCLLMNAQEIKKVAETEVGSQLVDEEDCENIQLFDDDETNPKSEIRNLLSNPVDVIFYREIALEAAES